MAGKEVMLHVKYWSLLVVVSLVVTTSTWLIFKPHSAQINTKTEYREVQVPVTVFKTIEVPVPEPIIVQIPSAMTQVRQIHKLRIPKVRNEKTQNHYCRCRQGRSGQDIDHSSPGRLPIR